MFVREISSVDYYSPFIDFLSKLYNYEHYHSTVYFLWNLCEKLCVIFDNMIGKLFFFLNLVIHFFFNFRGGGVERGRNTFGHIRSRLGGGDQ